MLARGFGPETASVSSGSLDPETLLESGRALSVLPRIKSRISDEVLRAELGDWVLETLGREFYANVATVMSHEEALRDIAEVSAPAGYSLVLLKGMALHFLGNLAAGSRRVADIDILVPVEEGEPLAMRCWSLPALGSRESRRPTITCRSYFTLVGALWRSTMFWTVCGFDGERWVTADQCLQAGQVQHQSAIPGNCFLPSMPLLVAQFLAHGLGHHGKAPDSYPAFQLVADLQDLGSAVYEDTETMRQVESWVTKDLSLAEIRAATELTHRLSEGELGSEIAREDSGCSQLLRHFVAGALDPTYRESLRLSRRFDPAPGQGRLQSLGQTAWSAVWLTNLQIDLLYGKPMSSAGYLGYRVWRPFDLMIRFVRYSRSWIVTRLKRGSWRG